MSVSNGLVGFRILTPSRVKCPHAFATLCTELLDEACVRDHTTSSSELYHIRSRQA